MVEEEEVSQTTMHPLGNPLCFTLKCCVTCLPCSYIIIGLLVPSSPLTIALCLLYLNDELEEVVFNYIVTLIPRPLIRGKEPGAGG